MPKTRLSQCLKKYIRMYRRPKYNMTLNFTVFKNHPESLMIESCFFVSVAGSTSLILLVVRLLVSHCLIPQINKIDSLNIEGGGQNQDKQPPKQVQITMQLAIKLLRTFDSLASIFSTCWLIVGACYVYSTYEIVTHHVLEDDNYCEYTAYTFAFIVITIGFISLVLSMIAALCACFCKSEDED